MTAQDLKNSILQLAVQGKLVEQRPEEGTANELYKQIQAKKQALIKTGKIKKEKKLPEITEDEKPFDIPESWMWCYVGDLFQHNTGKALNGSDKSGIPMTYITTSNLYWDRFELDNLKEMPFTESEVEKCTVQKDDLLVCEGGEYGRSAIWPYEYPMRIQNHIHKLRAYGAISVRYFYYVFYLYKNAGMIAGKGIAIQGLSANVLHALKMPLPPLAEQERIVAKIEELMPLVEEYGKAEERLTELNAAFPDKLRKSILQQAIQGKLTERDPADEPASELLKHIRTEKERLIKEGKIKKEKNLPPIMEEEIPFEIPENWAWVRLADVLLIQPTNGVSPKGVDYKTPFKNLTLTATTSGYFKPDSFKHVDIPADIAEKYYLKDEDILIQRSNSRELVGTSCVYRHGNDLYIYPDLIMRLHLMSEISVDYIDFVLKAPPCRSYYQESASGSSLSMPKINQATVRNTVIPLPPLAEQQRIVARVNELLAVCDELK